ncbi:MAG: DUF4347 domain-containing protein [Gammaproteobacteria bacterium]|nr:DUF4347 domain-containing protein [Gammaproteobacteria bacterium]
MKKYWNKQPDNHRYRAEPLEPRVLFSADIASLGIYPFLDSSDFIGNDYSYAQTLNGQTSDNPHSSLSAVDSNHQADDDSNSESSYTDVPFADEQHIELVFVDATVPDVQILLEDLGASDRNLTVLLVQPTDSGIGVISEALDSSHNVIGIHIISHSDGTGLQLGSDWLSDTTLHEYNDSIVGWQATLTENADILFYGCDLGGTNSGLALLQSIADLTGADVAASDDRTGHHVRSADWELETQLGSIDTQIALSDEFQQEWLYRLLPTDIYVTTTADEFDGDMSSLANLQANPGGSGLSLREAIEVAHTNSDVNDIYLNDGVYQILPGGGDQAGDFNIRTNLNIHGESRDGTIIDGDDQSTIFQLQNADFGLYSVTLLDGYSNTGGAGMDVMGMSVVDIDDVLFESNRTVSNKNGGALWLRDNSDAAITNSTFIDNSAARSGGAIYHDGGNLIINSSEFISNSSINDGGAIEADSDLTITNSTFVANTSSKNGGAIEFHNSGSNLTVSGSTFSANSTPSGKGGGINLERGDAIITQSTFFNNSASDSGSAIEIHSSSTLEISGTILAEDGIGANQTPLVTGTATSNGFNLITGTNTDFSTMGDMQNGIANLAALAYNGGSVQTHLLNTGSWAIDAGQGSGRIDANGVVANNYNDIGAAEYDTTSASQKMFWTDIDESGSEGIYRSNLDGTAVQLIHTPAGGGLAQDIEHDPVNDKLYWAQHASGDDYGSIWIMDTDGSNASEIITGDASNDLRRPKGISLDIDNRIIYIASDSQQDYIYSSNPKENAILHYEMDGPNYAFLGVIADQYQFPLISSAQMAVPYDIEFAENFDGKDFLVWSDQGSGSEPTRISFHNITDDTTYHIEIGDQADFTANFVAVAEDKELIYLSVSDLSTGESIIRAYAYDAGSDSWTQSGEKTLANDIDGLHYDTDTEQLFLSNNDMGLITALTWQLNDTSVSINVGNRPFALTLAPIAAVTIIPPTIDTSTVTMDEGSSAILTSAHLDLADTTEAAYDVNYTITLLPGHMTLSLTTDPLNAISTFTQQDINDGLVQLNHDGSETVSGDIEFSVTDGVISAPITGILDVDVSPVNDSPENQANNTLTVSENATAVVTNTHLNYTDDDASPVDILYTVTNTADGHFAYSTTPYTATTTFSQAQINAGDIVYTQTGAENDTINIDFTVTDGVIPTPINGVFSITVISVNDTVPTLPSDQSIEVNEGQIASSLTDGSLSLLDNVSDGDIGDSHTIGSVTQPSHGTLTWQSDGTFIYTHDDSETTSDSFTYTVVDAANNESLLYTVSIAILEQNDAPIVYQQLEEQFIVEDELLELTVALNHFSDSDPNDTLSYTATLSDGSSLPDWLTFDSSQGLLSGTPTGEYIGSIEVMVTATDSAATSSPPLLFQLSVLPANSAPTDIIVSSLVIEENRAAEPIGSLTVVDTDTSEPFTYSVDDDRFEIVNGVLSLRPNVSLNYEAEPSIDLQLTVTDSTNQSYSESVTIEVLDTNDAPLLTGNPEDTTMTSGGSYQLAQNLFTDADTDDSLSISAQLQNGEALPDWLEFDSDTMTFTTTDAPSETVNLTIVITAVDAQNASTSVEFTLTSLPTAAPATTTETLSTPQEPLVSLSAEPSQAINAVTPDEPKAESVEEADTASNPNTKPEQIYSNSERLSEVGFEHIDLSDLVKPLQRASTIFDGSLDLASITLNDPNTFNTLVETLNDFKFTETHFEELKRSYSDIAKAIDTKSESIQDELSINTKIVGTSVSITTGLSIGYLIWLIRGGTLVGSMLSSLPAWRLIDPLPVLGSMADDGEGDDDSLGTLLDKADAAAPDSTDMDVDSDSEDRPLS